MHWESRSPGEHGWECQLLGDNEFYCGAAFSSQSVRLQRETTVRWLQVNGWTQDGPRKMSHRPAAALAGPSGIASSISLSRPTASDRRGQIAKLSKVIAAGIDKASARAYLAISPSNVARRGGRWMTEPFDEAPKDLR
jgi:hypothetical protein